MSLKGYCDGAGQLETERRNFFFDLAAPLILVAHQQRDSSPSSSPLSNSFSQVDDDVDVVGVDVDVDVDVDGDDCRLGAVKGKIRCYFAKLQMKLMF